MIKENQQFLNRLNTLTDALIIWLMIPVTFWIRYILQNGIVNVTLREYMILGLFYTVVQIVIFYAFGLYRPYRHVPLRRELIRLLAAFALGFVLLLSWLSLRHMDNYSRQMLLTFFLLSFLLLLLKRVVLRRTLKHLREKGYNLKHVLLIGSGKLADNYLEKIETELDMGYHPLGYIAEKEGDLNIPYLGGYDRLESVLEEKKPDEVIDSILKNVRHGITKIAAKGAYKGADETMLYTVVNAFQTTEVVKYALEGDPQAFIETRNTLNVYGNYYQKPLD